MNILTAMYEVVSYKDIYCRACTVVLYCYSGYWGISVVWYTHNILLTDPDTITCTQINLVVKMTMLVYTDLVLNINISLEFKKYPTTS